MTQAEIDSNGGGDGDLDNTVTADSNETGCRHRHLFHPADLCTGAERGEVVDDGVGGSVGSGGAVHVQGDQHRQRDAERDHGERPRTALRHRRMCRAIPTTTASCDLSETWTYSCSHTVTQAEIDSKVGDLDNTVTADSMERADTDTYSIPLTRS